MQYIKKGWLCSRSMMSTPRCNPCTATPIRMFWSTSWISMTKQNWNRPKKNLRRLNRWLCCRSQSRDVLPKLTCFGFTVSFLKMCTPLQDISARNRSARVTRCSTLQTWLTENWSACSRIFAPKSCLPSVMKKSRFKICHRRWQNWTSSIPSAREMAAAPVNWSAAWR